MSVLLLLKDAYKHLCSINAHQRPSQPDAKPHKGFTRSQLSACLRGSHGSSAAASGGPNVHGAICSRIFMLMASSSSKQQHRVRFKAFANAYYMAAVAEDWSTPLFLALDIDGDGSVARSDVALWLKAGGLCADGSAVKERVNSLFGDIAKRLEKDSTELMSFKRDVFQALVKAFNEGDFCSALLDLRSAFLAVLSRFTLRLADEESVANPAVGGSATWKPARLSLDGSATHSKPVSPRSGHELIGLRARATPPAGDTTPTDVKGRHSVATTAEKSVVSDDEDDDDDDDDDDTVDGGCDSDDGGTGASKARKSFTISRPTDPERPGAITEDFSDEEDEAMRRQINFVIKKCSPTPSEEDGSKMVRIAPPSATVRMRSRTSARRSDVRALNAAFAAAESKSKPQDPLSWKNSGAGFSSNSTRIQGPFTSVSASTTPTTISPVVTASVKPSKDNPESPTSFFDVSSQQQPQISGPFSDANCSPGETPNTEPQQDPFKGVANAPVGSLKRSSFVTSTSTPNFAALAAAASPSFSPAVTPISVPGPFSDGPSTPKVPVDVAETCGSFADVAFDRAAPVISGPFTDGPFQAAATSPSSVPLTSPSNEAEKRAIQAFRDTFTEAMTLFEQREFTRAAKLFVDAAHLSVRHVPARKTRIASIYCAVSFGLAFLVSGIDFSNKSIASLPAAERARRAVIASFVASMPLHPSHRDCVLLISSAFSDYANMQLCLSNKLDFPHSNTQITLSLRCPRCMCPCDPAFPCCPSCGTRIRICSKSFRPVSSVAGDSCVQCSVCAMFFALSVVGKNCPYCGSEVNQCSLW